jgi:hypothetical protein
VLQNGAQQQLGNSWREICRTLREQHEPEEQFAGLTRRFAEQMVFGMSVTRSGLSWSQMSAAEHAYAWTLPFEALKTEVQPVVYHACGPFIDQAIRLERKGLINFSHPNISSILHKHFIKLQTKRLTRHSKDTIIRIINSFINMLNYKN